MKDGHDSARGRTVTRRQAVGLGGTAAAALLLGKLGGSPGPARDPLGAGVETARAQTPSCVLSPAKTEGPYFVEELLNRSDIRAGQAGLNLTLSFSVVNVDKGWSRCRERSSTYGTRTQAAPTRTSPRTAPSGRSTCAASRSPTRAGRPSS